MAEKELFGNSEQLNDLISRQAAIKAADSIIERDTSGNNDVVKAMTAWKEYIVALPSAQPGCEDTVYRKAVQMLLAYFVPEERYAEAVDGLRRLPSAQPSATDTNVATTDTISRRDAVEAMAELQGKAASKSELIGISKAWKRIKALPSAQSTMGQVNQGDTVNERAVKFLDLFAKTYCRDKSVTDDLKFRCSECEFEMPDKKCLVKCMARKLFPDYKDFGSMGDL